MLVSVPIHPELAEVSDRLPKDRPFLATQKDTMRSAGGLGNLMQRWTEDVKPPQCSGKALRRVFHQAIFTSLVSPDSRAFYDCKRAEGKHNHQAAIALARRRVKVLRAILRNREPFPENFKLAA